MKKYMFMAVAGMLALSSCSNDDNDITPLKVSLEKTFTAGFGDYATTRATLDGSTQKVTFDKEDIISILSAKNKNRKFITLAGGSTASFSGTATDSDATYYALYPYQDGLTLDGTTILNVDILISQCVDTTAWDPKAAIAYATTTGSTLTFHNVCALLKITNDSGDFVDIGVSCMEHKALTGKFNLDTSTGALTVQFGKGSSSVSARGVPPKTIYLAIAPGDYEDLSADWMNSMTRKYGSKMKMGTVTFQKGKIYDLGKTSDWNESF